MPDPIISGDTWGVIRTKINDLLGLTETVGASAAAAALSAQQAAIYKNIRLVSEDDITTDTTLTYNTGSATTVVVGDVVWAGTRRFLVLDASALTWSIANANGVKLIHAQDEVCPEMFGKIGVSASQDRAAIQAAIDTGKNVFFPSPSYVIDGSLTVGNQRLRGIANGPSIRRTQVIITVLGNTPCFVNPSDDWNSFDIEGFFIDYGDKPAILDSNNDLKRGFYFTGATMWPEMMRITSCTVRGALWGFYDDTGTYMSLLERVEARACRFGFYKDKGTTISFLNCQVGGIGVIPDATKRSEMGFYIRNVLSPSFTSCAADGLVPGEGATLGAANFFEGCPGVVINGWDAEANRIISNAGTARSYMRFTSGTADIRGFTGVFNELGSTEATQEVYLILNDGCNLTFGGDIAPQPSDLTYLSAGGYPITIKTENAGRTLISGAQVRGATGGTPSGVYSLLGVNGTSTDWVASKIIDLTEGASELLSLLRLNTLPLGAVGTTGMFLNATASAINEGQIVAGSSLIYAASSGDFVGVDSPSGSWMCLGSCVANNASPTSQTRCTSIFRRVA